MAYILSENSVTVFVDGKQYIADRSHQNFDAIVDAVKRNALREVPALADVVKTLQTYLDGKIEIDVDNQILKYKGEVLHNTLVHRILQMLKEGYDITPMVKFLDNLLENPSRRAVEELYTFLQVGNMPITDDGHFLAYKRVRADYKDIYSNTIDNSVGRVVEMRRNEVDDDKDRTCSKGLHFCSLSYIPNFHNSDNDRVMIVKINPRDVVSIPSDYNQTKGRCCRYEVVGEYTDIDLKAPQPAWSSSVVNMNDEYDDGYMYESDEDEYEDYDGEYDDKDLYPL